MAEEEPRVRVSAFDESAENHFRAMDRIAELCGEATEEGANDEGEIRRFSSSITFLREWRFFKYEAREIRFVCEKEKLVNGTSLPQFSSATVPNSEAAHEGKPPKQRDFVMYTGGPVWGLDWCPRVSQSSDSHGKCEFIAISAHPPGSSYHKIGMPLSGRGLVQIWCVLNVTGNNEDTPPVKNPKRGRPNNPKKKEVPMKVKRPRGRPRKNPKKDHVTESNNDRQIILHDSQLQENTSNFPGENYDNNLNLNLEASSPGSSMVSDIQFSQLHESQVHEDRSDQADLACNTTRSNNIEGLGKENDGIDQLSLAQKEHNESGQDLGASQENTIPGSLEISSDGSSITNDVDLPRVVLCLAHNGKVAWDVKWRPSNALSKDRMGYLAVLLGDGSLEVWEIPLPRTIKSLYSSLRGEGTDPRFVKLKPVFRSSMLKSGGVQSIPLTMEWSPSAPHELLLVGCHDGTVALWKFSASVQCKETRPLLRFSADTVPIRAIAWAPVESDSEGRNIILTAGYGSLKFWDIRDPYGPLWDLQPALRIIYSLDWLSDPRCVIITFDDGTMRMLSVTKALSDSPATGKPFSGTKLQGLHSFCCSSYAIWSVQVSRLTGLVAYCGADGTVIRFQLTSKAVEKDPTRHRAPHFLCGSLTTKDQSVVTVNSPEANRPLPMKKGLSKCGDTPIPVALKDILSGGNRSDSKKGKPFPSNDQPLPICYDENPETESEFNMTIASLKRREPQQHGSSSKKKPQNRQALVALDDEPRSDTEGKEKEKGGASEVLPWKSIAMHRVRWNMNKGSERWLCSGGAAGIVRCQEIVLSEIERTWAKKK